MHRWKYHDNVKDKRDILSTKIAKSVSIRNDNDTISDNIEGCDNSSNRKNDSNITDKNGTNVISNKMGKYLIFIMRY
jgi:hypothetical protein